MKKLLTIATALAVACAINTSAYALTINDTGVVGAFSGETAPNSSVPEELAAAQHLLDMAINTLDPLGCSLSGNSACYATGDNDYSGTLSGGVQVQNTGVLNAAALSSAFVLGKYDGPNAGYVLFHVADWVAVNGTSIPSTSATIWLNNQDNGYGLSHYTYFGSNGGGDPVPDGGTTLMLLGVAFGGLGMLRRRFAR